MDRSFVGKGASAVRAGALSALILAMLSVVSGVASGETARQRLDAYASHLKHMQSVVARMPKSAIQRLSSGAQHVLYAAERYDSGLHTALAQSMSNSHGSLNGRHFTAASEALRSGQVNDPSTDLAFSRMGGFVQSETSTAWCGRIVVVAYNDSGSFLETLPIPGIGLSFNGYSQSSDGGNTFTDQGYLNPGPSISNFLLGDPVIVCTDANTFLSSSIFTSGFDTAVSVSKSIDGGRTFGNPIEAVSKDGFTHFIDKPWMAVDPSNPQNVYVTYTDFDLSGSICTFGANIELVRSFDGGATWSAPTLIDSACFPDGNQGSNVQVDGAGNVFVAWEHFAAGVPTNEIDIVKSTRHGAAFAPKVVAAAVTPVGAPFLGLLQGGFRNNEFPSLAIDLSRGPGIGPLYLTWNDGGFTQIPDFLAGTYNFGDVLVSRSDNGGARWSKPVKVNNSKNAASSSGADHYLPGIAVDSTGALGVCWYDRRRDAENFLIDRECATSRDRGQNWVNHRITPESYSPSIAADLLVNPAYMGDYDATAADTLGRYSGFLGAFGDNSRGNPDVRISRRFGAGDDSGNEE